MDEIMQKAISGAVSTVLEFLVVVLIPYGMLLAREWIKAKTAAIKDKTLREGIEFAFDRLDKTAETVVREIEQVLKQRLDGKVVKPEVLLHNAISRTFKRLPPQALITLQNNYLPDDLQKIIRGKIESKVKKDC